MKSIKKMLLPMFLLAVSFCLISCGSKFNDENENNMPEVTVEIPEETSEETTEVEEENATEQEEVTDEQEEQQETENVTSETENSPAAGTEVAE